ncbi:MAG: tetratricopeptide repeat protein [Magnetovibrio sp.]|nr:tetratricopeptide repeat protein [Magnetovibrio sp.]
MLRTLAALSVAVPMAFPAAAETGGRAVESDMATAIEAYDGGRFAEAVRAWTRAARLGNTDAMTSLANMYMRGEDVRPDIRRGVAWYREAAARGDPVGQLNLGELYLSGLGVAKDRGRAYKWLALAGRAGNAWAADRAARLAGRMDAAERARAERLVATWRRKAD